MRISQLSVLTIAAAGVTFAASVSKDLQNLPTTAVTDVIVQFNASPTATQLGRVKLRGGTLKKQFRKQPRLALYSLPTVSVNDLLLNADVKFASKDRPLSGKLDYANPAVGAPQAFSSGWDGSNIGIAVIDSGVDTTHPDLAGRVVYSENFVVGETTTGDTFGHGTHVAVIAAGNAAASTGNNSTVVFRGIAPGAKIINFRVLNGQGAGTDSALISAIDRAIELKATYNIRVINLSLGRAIFESYTLDPLCRAVEAAWKAGIVVVVAAGNGGRNTSMGTNGYSTITSPGNDPFVLTVGATKDMKTASRGDDLVTTYSSKGPTLIDHIVKPDVVAPGNLIIAGKVAGTTIISAYPENEVPKDYYLSTQSTRPSSDYFTLSGTSMSAPVVSGIVAAMIEKSATLTPDLAKARLMRTATKAFPWSYTFTDSTTGGTYTVTHDIFAMGAGYVDMNAALNDSSTGTGAALSPQAVFDTATGAVWMNYSHLAGTTVVWGENVVWGEMFALALSAKGDK